MDRSDFFVSTAWLADHRDDVDVAVVDATFFMADEGRDARAEFAAGHIPGAVFFDIDAIADRSSPLPHMLPTPEAFAAAAGALGLSEAMRVVVYDATGLRAAPRVWWTLRTFGARHVRVLDGGLPQWRAEGRPVEHGPGRRPAGTFTPRLQSSAVVARAEVAALADAEAAAIVDARAADRFRGDVPEPRPGLRAGHIPTSRNVPWNDVVTDGRMKAPEALAPVFAAAGVDLARPVITTCGSGVTAAILLMALATMGKTDVRLYDGSWTDWGGDPGSAVATGPA